MPSDPSDSPGDYQFSTPAGKALVRSILKPYLPYDPHDYQIEGVCQSLDGVDLLAVLATGSGKTGYFTMYMLVLRSLSENPNLCSPPKKNIPKDPAIILVYPTLSLEEEMESNFRKLGLSTLVINNRTKAEAWKQRRENLWVTAQTGISMILLSPEMLSTKGYQSLMQSSTFMRRICAFGVDEVHLVNSWGAGFRPCFTQIGFARARLPNRTILILATASLMAGIATENVCRFFGLKNHSFHLIRRSNIRPDIRVIFRTLSHGLGGMVFPDLRWIVEQRRKTLVFCRTIHLGNRVATYLRSLVSPPTVPTIAIRLYNSLNWPDYNTETLRLFQHDPECSIIVATDTLMVGVDLPNVEDVVLPEIPRDPDEELQKIGRAGRNWRMVHGARGIVYVTQQNVKDARALLQGKKLTGAKKRAAMNLDMARMITADCKTDEQNRLYDNPPSDTPCLCRSCTTNPRPTRMSCDCGGCVPEVLPSAPVVAVKKSSGHGMNLKANERVSRAMRAHGTQRLLVLRETLYRMASQQEKLILPPYVFLPDPVIQNVLSCFPWLKTIEDLNPLLRGQTYLENRSGELWAVVLELRETFATMREEKKIELALRRAEKAAAVNGPEGSPVATSAGVGSTQDVRPMHTVKSSAAELGAVISGAAELSVSDAPVIERRAMGARAGHVSSQAETNLMLGAPSHSNRALQSSKVPISASVQPEMPASESSSDRSTLDSIPSVRDTG
ncbi:P-loop containing nucleoside triphosphate hydrolase protein [Amylocystis lapponica]|nr:P-loop containing nucleoside triphosphate hydrolase protein [Amylocystis lapponica]